MTGFDPAELARLAEVSAKWDRRIALSHTPLGNEALIEMVQDDARTLNYFTTHRVAIVAALTRAQETEKAIERARAVRLADSPGGHHYHYRDGFEDAMGAVIAALGGATTTTGDTP